MYKHYINHTNGEGMPAAILVLAESVRGGAWHVGQGIGESIEDISPIRVDTKVNGRIGVEAMPSEPETHVSTVAAKRGAVRKKRR
jgi:hypothetical protein